jgi:hypothetical protein
LQIVNGARQSPGLDAFRDLERFFATASRAQLGLPDIEREAERRGRELVRLCLQTHLDGRGDGDVGPALELDTPQGQVRLTHKRSHTRRLLTLFGPVIVTRVGYGAKGHLSIHPLDAELQLPARSYSYEISRRLIRAAVCGPFDEAITVVAEMTGVTIPKRSAEELVREAAVDFDAFYAARGRPGGKLLPAGQILVGAIDCKGIPMVKPEPASKVVRRRKGEKPNKKKMATVGTVHVQPARVRTPQQVLDSLFANANANAASERDRGPRQRPTDKRVWASLLAGKDTFIADVRAEMTRRDPRHRRTWVIVTDGERALQRRVAATFRGVTLILDLLHVLEKLWKAAYVLHPEGSPEATAFVYQRAERILNGQVSQVVKGLRQTVTKRRLTGAEAKTLLDVAGYYYANRERMRYDSYLANGWPIASGSVEGACKNLVRDRFERSGMRWTPATAEAMLKLRAIYLSDDLDAYWEFHVQQDQQRLHNQQWRVVQK